MSAPKIGMSRAAVAERERILAEIERCILDWSYPDESDTAGNVVATLCNVASAIMPNDPSGLAWIERVLDLSEKECRRQRRAWARQDRAKGRKKARR